MNIILRKAVFRSGLLFRCFSALFYIQRKLESNFEATALISRIIDNNVYGHHHLLEALELDDEWFIEHGLFFGDHVQFDEFCYGNKVITFSEYRKQKILQHNPNCSVKIIGPYIKYFPDVEKCFGLRDYILVFPPHSSKVFRSEFSVSAFHKVVEDCIHRTGAQGIMLCWYYLDMESSDNLDFSVPHIDVTAGSRWNKDFLVNLKSFIVGARNTVSFNVGTHVGYCVALEKPHFIADIGWTQSQIGSVSQRDEALKNADSRKRDLNEVLMAFRDIESLAKPISHEQRRIVAKYWGL